jgi:hypothetical protein
MIGSSAVSLERLALLLDADLIDAVRCGELPAGRRQQAGALVAVVVEAAGEALAKDFGLTSRRRSRGAYLPVMGDIWYMCFLWGKIY